MYLQCMLCVLSVGSVHRCCLHSICVIKHEHMFVVYLYVYMDNIHSICMYAEYDVFMYFVCYTYISYIYDVLCILYAMHDIYI